MEKEQRNIRKIGALETKNKIYTTANRLFRKYGYENISVDAIVEAAGVSKGSFYVHFNSKDALVAALLSDYVHEIDLDYKTYLDSFDAETSASHILMCLIEKIADVITDAIGYENMKMLYRVQITKTINTDAVMGYNREIYKMFTEILNKGIEQGEFTTQIPIDTLTKHFMIAMRGITYEWCIRYSAFDYKEEALKHFELLLIGIKK